MAQLQAASGAFRTVGTLAFGTFADSYGPKAALVAAHVAALSGSVVLAGARSRDMLFLSLVPLLGKHGFQAAQQVAASHSKRNERTVAMGRIGMSYGLGFMGGTFVISWLAHHLAPREIAWLAAAVDAGMVAVVLLAYPANEGGSSEEAAQQPASSGYAAAAACVSGAPGKFGHALMQPRVARMLLFKTAAATSAGMVLNMMQHFAMSPFGLSVAQTGVAMSYLGGLHLISQSVIVPALKVVPPRTLQLWTAATVGASLLALSRAQGGVAYMLLLGPLHLASHTTNMLMTSTLTCLVPQALPSAQK